MRYIPLGETDLNVSVLALGTWVFGGERGQVRCDEVIVPAKGGPRTDGSNLVRDAGPTPRRQA